MELEAREAKVTARARQTLWLSTVPSQDSAVFKQVEQLRQADYLLSKNDMMLVADLGAGTADFVCYQVMSDLKDPGRIQLKTVKCPING